MKIAILGFAGQGQAAYEYWNTPENELTICDLNADVTVPAGVNSKLGPDYLKDLHTFDLLVRTPILHPRDIEKANPDHPEVMNKVTSVTNEFLKVCPSRNIIGVTGTKGKGTTSTLITRILEAAGKKVHLGGNIGIPPLDMLKDNIQPDDWVVLELANFQLIDLKYSPPIAVCLMVEAEHQDWHGTSVEEYVGAKQQMFVHQTNDNIAIYYPESELSTQVASVSPGQKIPYMQEPGAIIENEAVVMDGKELCKTSELKLLGKHNWQNVCAAVTATWQVSQDVGAIRSALISFSGLPYRIESRGDSNGVEFYNDSFAVAPAACIAAIQAIPKDKVMIIGGKNRGSDLSYLVDTVKVPESNVKNVVLIGESADLVASEFEAHGFSDYRHCRSKDMKEIVKFARDLANPGEAVVLSPAFPSFDMFKNFEDRGNKFNEAVDAL